MDPKAATRIPIYSEFYRWRYGVQGPRRPVAEEAQGDTTESAAPAAAEKAVIRSFDGRRRLAKVLRAKLAG